MKQFIKYLLPVVLLGTAVSCSKNLTDPSNPYTGNFTLRSQAEVEAFGARENANCITVTGVDITDLSPLDVAAVGTLVIRNTGIEELVLPNVTSIATRIEISNNESLTALRELGLKFSIGDMMIGDNPLLTDISGMIGLKKMSGKLIVTGNSLLGEDNAEEPETYGFNVIKYLVDNAVLRADRVTLSNNHPLAATDASLIGQGGSGDGVFSYTVKSDSEAANLSIKGTEVKDLIVTGAAVTDEGMALLASKITAVKGTVTIDGASLKTTETFFGKVECRGGIVLRNITTYDIDGANKFFNTNGFKGITHIYGDFILENIPYMIHWGAGNGFAQIKQIDGNFTVRNSGMQQLAFRSLETVGGNMTIDNNSLELYTGFLWNLITDLKSVGGNFTYTNNDHVNGLGGMEKITRIGGDVTITGNGTDVSAGGGIPYKTIPGQVGFDLVEKWITTGGVQSGAVVDCRYADGTAVEFSGVPAPDEYKSYTVTGRAELLVFAPQDGSAVKETVQNLTIRGNGDQISDSDMSFVKTRVEKVRGTLTIEGISGLSTTEILLLNNGEGFTVDGGIVFRSCPELMNLNGMKSLTAIGGDLVFENCPKIATIWGAGNCLSQIQSVKGSLKLTGVSEGINGLTFLSLKSVGGDMVISDNTGNFWNFNDGMKVETIGGGLTIANNAKLNGLGGFEALKSVGGNVTVSGNGGSDGYIPVQTQGNQTGLAILGQHYKAGVFASGAVFTIESAGVNYQITEL